MILVTGATGQVNREVTRQLVVKGLRPRVLARTPETVRAIFGDAVDVVEGDTRNEASVSKALEGVKRAFVLSLPPDLGARDGMFANAAKTAGVERLVKISTYGAAGATDGISLWHRQGEEAIAATGIHYTFVRPGSFMSNSLSWIGMIKNTGKVFAPTGDGRVAAIHPADIASVIVCALTEDGHDDRAYELTGSELLTTGEMVATLARFVGKPIEYVNVPEETAREQMLQRKMPADVVDSVLGFLRAIREGRAAFKTDTVEQVTKNRPRTFAQWAEENARAFL